MMTTYLAQNEYPYPVFVTLPNTHCSQVAVAVKTLKTGSTVEEKIDFLSEADMMKRFDHRNVVKLLGVCTRNEPVYTVMEFMLYGDLKTYLLARYSGVG